MSIPERPRLRPGLGAARDRDPRYVLLFDRLGIVPRPLRLTLDEFLWVHLFDGEHTFRDVQAAAMRHNGGVLLPLERVAALAGRLDEARFLDGPVREPSCIGCYAADPGDLRRQLGALFAGPDGPGAPEEKKPDGALRAALIPHIDYQRGGVTYAWGYKEVFERTDASLFVIVGTAHYSPMRFTLTRKHFRTPLGVAPTDQRFIDRLVRHYGDGLFDDEPTHLREHSVELEVVFLQYLYEGRRPIRIVPLLVGSFGDSVRDGGLPRDREDVGRMVEVLRQAEAETDEPVCYIISGDLAHIGPYFDADDPPAAGPLLAQSRAEDQAILERAEAADAAGFFEVIAAEGDRRRICGLPPAYTTLEAVRPARGKVLHDDQYVHPRGEQSVSFASVAFYR